jgi:hypothetical protein
MVPYLGIDHDTHPELPPERTGCIIVSNGGISTRYAATLGFSDLGARQGFFAEWRLSGSDTVDIDESTNGEAAWSPAAGSRG